MTAEAAKEGQPIPNDLRAADDWTYFLEPAPGEDQLTWLVKNFVNILAIAGMIVVVLLVVTNLVRERSDARRSLRFATDLTGDDKRLGVLMRNELRRAGNGRWASLVIAGGLPAFAPPKLADLDKRLQFLDALISLFPVNRSTVHPSIMSDPSGSGDRITTIEILNRSKDPPSTAWTVRDAGNGAIELRIAAGYAAAWLLLAAKAALPDYDGPPADSGGTTSPESFGAVRAGAVCYEQGHWAAARSYFQEAVDLDPGYATAALNLATSIAATGRQRDLVDAYRRFLPLVGGRTT